MKIAVALAFALASLAVAPRDAAASEGCYICNSGSSGGCQQCSYGDKDTHEARKACEKRGCKIGGTKSCSTAANVKSCAMPARATTRTAARTCDAGAVVD